MGAITSVAGLLFVAEDNPYDCSCMFGLIAMLQNEFRTNHMPPWWHW